MLTFVPPDNVFLVLVNVLTILNLFILAEVVISWAQYFGARGVSRYNPWVRRLHSVTDPVLSPLRRLLPPHRTSGLDISPLLAVLAIQILQTFLYGLGAPLR